MTGILKAISSFIVFLIVLFFIKTIFSITTEWNDWISTLLSLFCALLVGWYSWQWFSGHDIGVGAAMLSSALIVGGLGFVFGFLGPMLIMRDTQQAAFIGIFIASPLGMVLGAFIGYTYISRQKR